MRKVVFILLAFVTLSCGQSSTFSHKRYCIGIDSSFFPVELAQQQTNVYAFSLELFAHIAKTRKVEIQVIDLAWDNLFDELSLGKVDAVVSAAPPNLINGSKYAFSDPLLRTGPVLIVPKNSEMTSLEDLAGKVVSTRYGSDEIELISSHPETEFIFYDRFNEALDQVWVGNTQGTLVPIIPAARYVEDLFQQHLKIVSSPLTREALRLVTPLATTKAMKNSHAHGVDESLVQRRKELLLLFNTSIEQMMSSGEYHELLHKWDLSQ